MEKLCSLLAIGLLAAVVWYWGVPNNVTTSNAPARVQMSVAR